MSHTRTALVTGAGSGIGAAIAARLVSQDVSVICADVNPESVRSVAAELGTRAFPLWLDIAEAESVSAGIEFAAQRFDTLDILVNNAGISDSTPTASLDVGTFRRVLEVDLVGALALTMGLLPQIRSSRAGRILNIASVQALVPAADTLSYAVAKGALVTFTKALATDVAPYGILVNALAPGFIDTPMAVLPGGKKEYETDWFRQIYLDHRRLPLRRPGRADEVAGVAAFFVSAENSYVTGQVLAVDGGLTATF